MSDQGDEFERYLRGDSGLSRAYRELGSGEPPADIDAAVRRAARTPPGTAHRRRLVPLAAAAVLVLCFGLVLRITTAPPAPTAEPRTTRVEPGAAEPAMRLPPRLPADAGREKARALETAASAKTAAGTPGESCTPPHDTVSPERRLDFVICLRDAGAHESARRELAQFRNDYPDFPIPEPLQNL